MLIQFLGTGAGCPSLRRNVSSIAFILNSPNYEVWLFDCGESTQNQILKSYVKINKIKKIFITHLHGDHILGLPGLLTTMSVNNYKYVLEIYGCKGIKSYVNYSLKITNSYINYSIKIYEISEGEIFNNGIFKVNSIILNHNIECYGFYIKILKKKGSLNVNKLILDGILPGPIYKYIKNNDKVILPDGRIIKSYKYLGKTIKSKKIFIFGDTSPIKIHIKSLFNSDLLIHEATLDDKYRNIANKRGHSTNIQAALIAKEYFIKNLIITHISSRYKLIDLNKILLDCLNIFPNTFLAYDLYKFNIK